MRMKPLLIAALVPLAVAPVTMRAQAATPTDGPANGAPVSGVVTRTGAPCDYATCALRVEPRRFLGPQLVRGTMGSSVMDLSGPRASELGPLFAGNDSASHYGNEYLRAARANRGLTLGGLVLGAIGLAQPDRMNGYTAAGASMLVVSLPFQFVEERALSRAVWWYNAALSRGQTGH